MTQIANVSSAPTNDGRGRRPTVSGTRYGRRRFGSLKRNLITASCVAVNASRTPKLNKLARKKTGCVSVDVTIRPAIAISAAATIDCGETSVRGLSQPNFRGNCPCSPSEYASRPNPEIDVVAAVSKISAPDNPTKTCNGAPTAFGTWWRICATTPISGERSQLLPSWVPCAGGNADSATIAIATYS